MKWITAVALATLLATPVLAGDLKPAPSNADQWAAFRQDCGVRADWDHLAKHPIPPAPIGPPPTSGAGSSSREQVQALDRIETQLILLNMK